MPFRNCFVILTPLRCSSNLTKCYCRWDIRRHFYSCNVKDKESCENGTRLCEHTDTRQPVTRLALKLLYIGASYNGMQYQDSLCNTIEEHLFKALVKLKLIHDRRSCRFQKSSRTDIGVSAISQVVAFDVHHEFMKQLKKYAPRLEQPTQDVQDSADVKHFNSPVRRINKLLPLDIKVLAWALVPEEFSPRRQKGSKSYKYWFRKEGLNLKVMTDASKKFEGTHDFRNLCTLQYRSNFVCHVTSATINQSEDDPKVCVFTVSADRFLTHQIRYMMGILFLIGQGREDPEVIDELLNVETNPCKPSYVKAPGSSLCLYRTELLDDIKWVQCADAYKKVYKVVHQKYKDSILMATMTKGILDELKNTEIDTEDGSMKFEEIMGRNTKPTRRKSIMSNSRGPTVEAFLATCERRILRKKILKGEVADILPEDTNDVEILYLTTENVHQDLPNDLKEDCDEEKNKENGVR